MLSVQVLLGAILAPDVQVLLVTLNSAPLTEVVPSTRAALPVLVSVMV